MKVVAFDTETHLIGPENIFPKMVCITLSQLDTETNATEGPFIASCHVDDFDALCDILDRIDKADMIVGHNVAYDVGVLIRELPDFADLLYQKMAEGKVQCTRMNEKLMNLATTGSPYGISTRSYISLADLSLTYLGIDISSTKTESDAWRTNYDALDGMPLSEWPANAVEYALGDADITMMVWHEQQKAAERISQKIGVPVLKVAAFRAAVDCALRQTTSNGIHVDAEEKAKLEQEYAAELDGPQVALLIETGILRPAESEQPYANNAKNPDGTTKMKAAKHASIDTKRLTKYVLEVCTRLKIEPLYTDKGKVSIAEEWREEHAHKDPVLAAYDFRQKLQKMITTEIPRMNDADGNTAKMVHVPFDSLKETGRCSSSADKLFPSINGQNVDPRARVCYVPRPDHLFLSLDYNQMELGTVAQVCLSVFDKSVLAETINEGIDVHSYTGSQLAFSMDTTFQQECVESNANLPMEVFEAFSKHKESDPGFHKHWRTFAKPTNLGYPGGLGPETFVRYAKTSYGVEVNLEQATEFRTLWKDTYPEFWQYFDWVGNDLNDPHNPDAYAYITPMGMYRANCTFCAAANGAGLQSPSAEGALAALWETVRRTICKETDSLLTGCRVVNFIHDEIMLEVPILPNEDLHKIAKEVESIMVEAMRRITPDVTPRCEAAYMDRWYKEASPVYDENGHLTVWRPADEQRTK